MMRRLLARLGLAAGLVLGIALLTTPVVSPDNRISFQDDFSMTASAVQVVAGVTGGSASGGCGSAPCATGCPSCGGGGGGVIDPSYAAPLVAGVTLMVAALVLFLPALMRAVSTWAEAEESVFSEGSDGASEPPDNARTAGSGPHHPGSGEIAPQPLPTATAQGAPSQATATPSATSSPAAPHAPTPAQHPAVQHPSGTSSTTTSAQQSAAPASGSAPNLPSLPDTPDVPESPEALESLQAQMGTPAASDEAEEVETEEVETEEVEAAASESHTTREYTPGALAQMQALDVSSARVEEVIRRGAATAALQPGTTVYAAPEGGLLVTLDASNRTVVAVVRRSV